MVAASIIKTGKISRRIKLTSLKLQMDFGWVNGGGGRLLRLRVIALALHVRPRAIALALRGGRRYSEKIGLLGAAETDRRHASIRIAKIAVAAQLLFTVTAGVRKTRASNAFVSPGRRPFGIHFWHER